MAKTRVKPNSQGILALLNSDDIRDHLEDVALDAADRAEALAPVETGEYASSIEGYAARGYDRWIGIVRADVEHGLVVEARHAPLWRGVEGGGQE